MSNFEGKGYITEAVRALKGELFKLGFNRVEIRCNALNIRSSNVPRACGYVHEGTLRESEIELGKFRDTMVFSKLKKDFKLKKTIKNL